MGLSRSSAGQLRRTSTLGSHRAGRRGLGEAGKESSARSTGDDDPGGAGAAGVTGTQSLVSTNLDIRPNSQPDKESFKTSPFRDAQWAIAPCHLLRNGSLLRLWRGDRAPSRSPPSWSMVFTAYTSTNSSGLPILSRCSCVQRSRSAPPSARDTHRSTFSITLAIPPPRLRAFYGLSRRFVYPVTIEPQHLEDRDTQRTHIRRQIYVARATCAGVFRSPSARTIFSVYRREQQRVRLDVRSRS